MTSDFENDPGEPLADEIEPPPATMVALEWAAPSKEVLSPRPWGPWATVGWTLLCLVVLVVAQIAAFIIFIGIRFALNPNAKFGDATKDGNLLAVATFPSTLAIVCLIALLVWVRGCRIREYLALIWPGPRSIVLGMIGLGVVLGTTDMTSYLLGRPLVPEVMVDLYRTGWLPLLLLALTVLAPLGEETLFRGFLYKGIASSRAGPVTAIVVSTVVFALIHIQYDWYGILAVAAMGLYLGVVRYGSGSLLLTMLVHGIANAVSTAEMAVQEHWLR